MDLSRYEIHYKLARRHNHWWWVLVSLGVSTLLLLITESILSQPKFITSPSYDQLHSAALAMVREARSLAWIDCVVAPARGGLLHGVIASHKLNVPLVTIHYSSKRGEGDDKNHKNELPFLAQYKTIYLCEDICDSGHTLKELAEHYTAQGCKVISSVFHYKETAVYHPDLYFWLIQKDSEFICYPWESA